ncbi:uncharacterized protein LOC112090687 isoform X1 [Morus notabilis]|uniref:uncharacterized protein LOC112090687 isoform X1 n=1 Tax=Morus notabilis TaxID=981085 RepID=UPI000CED3738|nr:uncharacterized protein LOC112090687 isoform X1 [Morus notabilis]
MSDFTCGKNQNATRQKLSHALYMVLYLRRWISSSLIQCLVWCLQRFRFPIIHCFAFLLSHPFLNIGACLLHLFHLECYLQRLRFRRRCLGVADCQSLFPSLSSPLSIQRSESPTTFRHRGDLCNSDLATLSFIVPQHRSKCSTKCRHRTPSSVESKL